MRWRNLVNQAQLITPRSGWLWLCGVSLYLPSIPSVPPPSTDTLASLPLRRFSLSHSGPDGVGPNSLSHSEGLVDWVLVCHSPPPPWSLWVTQDWATRALSLQWSQDKKKFSSP